MPSSRRGSIDMGDAAMEHPVRKHPRMKEYDYSQEGCYFITFCVKDHRCCLGKVYSSQDETESPKVELSQWGRIVSDVIERIPKAYKDVILDCYAVMPNHVHLLLTLGCDSNSSIPTIVRGIKTLVTKTIGQSIWQDSYYDHVIRNEQGYKKVWEYVNSNAAKWLEDRYYRE